MFWKEKVCMPAYVACVSSIVNILPINGNTDELIKCLEKNLKIGMC